MEGFGDGGVGVGGSYHGSGEEEMASEVVHRGKG